MTDSENNRGRHDDSAGSGDDDTTDPLETADGCQSVSRADGTSAADGRRRTRFFGMIAAGAAMVMLALVTWVAVDGGSDTPQDTGAASSSDDSEGEGEGEGEKDTNQDDRSSTSENGTGQSEELTEHLLSLQRRETDDPLAMGAVDAPVVLIMYEDFRCPYCAKFAKDVQPELEPYIESGDLRLEWRDYPIFGEESMNVAKAARAAGQQDRFWEFYEEAFALGGEGHPEFPDKRIRKIAERAGIPDMKQFDQDRKSDTIAEEINADMTEGQQIGVSSTPAFLINTQAVLGTQPVQTFETVIEQELENS